MADEGKAEATHDPDAQATARGKHACPACGGEAVWNPGKQALVCPYCGTVAPMSAEPADEPSEDVTEGVGGQIVEHDLVAALRGIPDDQRGWQADTTTVRCQSCRAISVFDAKHVGQRCDFCGSSSLVPYEQVKDPFRPESLLPLKVSETQARDYIRAWYGKVWFAPNKLKHRALTDTVKGVYLPYWTFDAQAAADWTAESGYHYYTTEQYRDSQGNTQTRQVQHTRWQPSWGHVDHFFDDELVAASMGVPEAMLRKIEPFPTEELVPYDPKFLSGWVVERYQIDLIAAAQRSRDVMSGKLESLCRSQVPGDTQRGLRVNAQWSEQTFKHILVPVWLLTYKYGPKNFQVLMNGYTGKVAGDYPKSWIKITLLVLAILILIGVIATVANQAQGGG